MQENNIQNKINKKASLNGMNSSIRSTGKEGINPTQAPQNLNRRGRYGQNLPPILTRFPPGAYLRSKL